MAKDSQAQVYFDRKTLKFEGLTDAAMQQLRDSYKSVDVTSELSKMELWLQSSKGKQRKGNIGFVLNWLNKVAPKGPSINEQLDWFEDDSPLTPYLQEYRRDLWTGREHILKFNTIKL